MTPYGRQSINEDDIAAVVRALRSEFLTCGPEVEAFERELAELVGAKHVVAVSNATAALHLALRVANIGPGDRVVTSPNTFLASANCAAYVGATPDFSDIDPVSYNLDPEKLDADWRRDTKAVVVVDYAGQPADLPRIAEIARRHGAIVLEDACHGIGGGFSQAGRSWKLGGHPWADMTIFSFHPVKTMTTAEGGVLVTDNDDYAAKARLLRTHGVTRNAADFVGLQDPISHLPSPISSAASALSEHGPWYYEMQDLGYNYRITDLQCALGRSQLNRLPGFIKRRQEIVAAYNESFTSLDLVTTPQVSVPKSPPSTFSFQLSDLSLHLYTVQIDFAALGKTRAQTMTALRERGVGTQVLYIPVHLQPWYRKTYGYGLGKCPVAETFYTRCLSLPLFPSMSGQDMQLVIEAIRSLA